MNFRNSDFEFVSDFDIRISSLFVFLDSCFHRNDNKKYRIVKFGVAHLELRRCADDG